LAAASDAMPIEAVKALIERGADVNVKSPDGLTALRLAKRHGETTPIVDLLVKAGAMDEPAGAGPAAQPKPADSIRAAVTRTLPLLQRTDEAFIRKTGCVSCHNNTLTAMTVAAARSAGLPVDDDTARRQVKTIAAYLDGWRER